MTDSLIFIAQRKSRDILQTRKYSAHCDRSIKDARQNTTIVVSLEKFNIVLLFLRYVRVPFDWNNKTCRYMSANIFMSTSTCFFHVDDMST